jgi:dTDP-4-amino-4,6-dideoxygalactose transaminase
MGGFLDSVKRQRENGLYLLENLEMENASLPRERQDCWSNYYQFPIRFEDSEQRDLMADYLMRRGIDSAKYLDDIVQVAKEHYNYSGDCQNAEHSSKTVLSIPHHYTLSSAEIDHIISCLNEGSRYLTSRISARTKSPSISPA